MFGMGGRLPQESGVQTSGDERSSHECCHIAETDGKVGSYCYESSTLPILSNHTRLCATSMTFCPYCDGSRNIIYGHIAGRTGAVVNRRGQGK